MASSGVTQFTDAQLEQIGEFGLAPNKGLQIGPFIITMALDSFFCGIFLMQVSHYVTHYPNDRKLNKALVVGLTMFAVGLSITTLAWVFDLFVLNFGTYYHFFYINFLAQFYVCDAIVTIFVQAWFAWRAFELTNRNWFLLVAIAGSSIVGFVMGILVKVVGDQQGSSANDNTPRLLGFVYTWLGMTVLADLLITVTILVVMFKKRTGWAVTDNLVKSLIRLTFESQLPPTMNAIALGLEFYFLKLTVPFISIPFIVLQSKLYSFSVLHTLNAREKLTQHGSDNYTMHGGASMANIKAPGTAPGSARTESKSPPSYRSFMPSFMSSKNGKSETGSNGVHVNTETVTQVASVDIILQDMQSPNKFTNRVSNADGPTPHAGSLDEGNIDDDDKYGSSVYGSKSNLSPRGADVV